MIDSSTRLRDRISTSASLLVLFYRAEEEASSSMRQSLQGAKNERQDIVAISVNVAKPEGSALAGLWNVHSIPSLLVYSNGALSRTISGSTTTSQILGVIGETTEPHQRKTNSEAAR